MLFVLHVDEAVFPVPFSLVVTCWERADLLALLYVMFSCVFVTFPYDVLGQVWYLIVLIPYLCLLFYFYCYFFRLPLFLPLLYLAFQQIHQSNHQ